MKEKEVEGKCFEVNRLKRDRLLRARQLLTPKELRAVSPLQRSKAFILLSGKKRGKSRMDLKNNVCRIHPVPSDSFTHNIKSFYTIGIQRIKGVLCMPLQSVQIEHSVQSLLRQLTCRLCYCFNTRPKKVCNYPPASPAKKMLPVQALDEFLI